MTAKEVRDELESEKEGQQIRVKGLEEKLFPIDSIDLPHRRQ